MTQNLSKPKDIHSMSMKIDCNWLGTIIGSNIRSCLSQAHPSMAWQSELYWVLHITREYSYEIDCVSLFENHLFVGQQCWEQGRCWKAGKWQMPPSSSLCLQMLPNSSGSNLGQKKLVLSLDFPLCLPWSPGHYLARLFEVRPPHRYQEVTERHGSDNK